MASENKLKAELLEKLKAELLELRMAHPGLMAEFIRTRAELWKNEERADRIKIEMALQRQRPDGEP